jgi:hypothetical protein
MPAIDVAPCRGDIALGTIHSTGSSSPGISESPTVSRKLFENIRAISGDSNFARFFFQASIQSSPYMILIKPGKSH